MRGVHNVLAAGNRHSAIAGQGTPDIYAVIHDRDRAGNRLGGYLTATSRIHRLGDDQGNSQGLSVCLPQRLDNVIRFRLYCWSCHRWPGNLPPGPRRRP